MPPAHGTLHDPNSTFAIQDDGRVKTLPDAQDGELTEAAGLATAETLHEAEEAAAETTAEEAPESAPEKTPRPATKSEAATEVPVSEASEGVE